MKIKKIILALTLVVALNIGSVAFAGENTLATNELVQSNSGTITLNSTGPMDPPPM